ncbi:MAG: glucose 1-dehydrogenase [Actinobacteria bacterium]|nr:glucose 1-dehydrogenase [Actinomycetota bacterium]
MFAIGLKRGIEGVRGFEVDKPSIQADDQVLVRVVEAGIDGTDRNIVGMNLFEPPDGEDLMILGHEAVGQVEEVGPAVKSLSEGDIVVPTVRRGCGLCAPCLHGMSDFCQTGLYKERGIHGLHGYFTEYFVDDEEYIVKVPDGLERLAVLAEPLSIGEKAIAGIRHIQERLPWFCAHPQHGYGEPGWSGCKDALVIGAGPLGLLSIALLRLDGVHTYVTEIAPEYSLRVELAKGMGAHYISAKGNTPEKVGEIAGELDIMIEAAGASTLALELVTVLGRNGIYVMTGIPRGREEVCLDGREILRRLVRFNQVIFGSVNSNRRHFESALGHLHPLLETFGPIFSRLVTSRYPISDYETAFSVGGEEAVKVVFEVSQFEMAAGKEKAA